MGFFFIGLERKEKKGLLIIWIRQNNQQKKEPEKYKIKITKVPYLKEDIKYENGICKCDFGYLYV